MAKKSIGMKLTHEEFALIQQSARRNGMLMQAWCRGLLNDLQILERQMLDREFPPYVRAYEKSLTVIMDEELWEKCRFVAHSLGVSLARWARTRLVNVAIIHSKLAKNENPI